MNLDPGWAEVATCMQTLATMGLILQAVDKKAAGYKGRQLASAFTIPATFLVLVAIVSIKFKPSLTIATSVIGFAIGTWIYARHFPSPAPSDPERSL